MLIKISRKYTSEILSDLPKVVMMMEHPVKYVAKSTSMTQI
nr:unknown [Mus musculus]